MKILQESIQDIDTFLKSKDLVDQIRGKKDSQEVCQLVVDECSNRFDDKIQPIVERVFVLSVDQEMTDVIEDDHYAVRYNNYYYDYTADQFKDAFDVAEEDMPVIQPVLPESRLTNTVSTIKRYALLKYV
jgi:hypothetical protein